MSDEAIAFDKLDVLRAPGFNEAGFSVEGLSAGINVIYGPNASGKTTTARSIQSLLWTQRPELAGATLVGHLRVGDAHWRVDLDRGRASFQREGAGVSEGPEVPPADHRDRYYLCLHELLEADNGSLAGLIMKESAGGFDVSAARESLGYSLSTPHKGKAAKDVEQAKKQRKAAKNEQAKLHQEEQRLRALRQELDGVRASSQKKEALQLAIDSRQAEAQLHAAEEQLQAFPSSVAEVRGDEQEDLDEQRSLLSAAESDQERAQQTIEECERKLEASALSEEGLPEGLLETLDGYIPRLESLQRDYDALERELADAETKRDEALRAVGGVADPAQVADIDTQTLQEISRLVREADQIRGERRFYAKLEEVLGSADAPEQLERLRDGIRALQRWLSSADPDAGPETDGAAKTGGSSGTARLVAMVCAVIVAAASVALGILVHLAWLGLFVVSAMLIWQFISLQPTAAAKESRRAIYRRDFEKIGVPQPGAWTEDAVEGHLDQLAKQWMSGMVEAEKSREWASHTSTYQGLEDRAEALDAKRSELAERVGLTFGEEAELSVLISNIRDWQEANSAVAAKEAQLEKADGQIQGLLGRMSGKLTGYDFDPVFDPTEAKARVNAFEAAWNEVGELQKTLLSAERDLEAAKETQEAAKEAARKLFERLEVELGDDQAVARLCEQKAGYHSAYEQHLRAENTAQSEQQRLENHPAYSAELVERDAAELYSELEEEERQAAKEAGLVEQIHDIETRIRQAKKSHDVEAKGAEYEAKLEELNREREADYRSAARSCTSPLSMTRSESGGSCSATPRSRRGSWISARSPTRPAPSKSTTETSCRWRPTRCRSPVICRTPSTATRWESAAV